MKTIETYYIPATNFHGTRIKATDRDNNFIVDAPNGETNDNDEHAKAAAALCKKMGWAGTLQGGHTKRGMIWTFIDKQNQITIK